AAALALVLWTSWQQATRSTEQALAAARLQLGRTETALAGAQAEGERLRQAAERQPARSTVRPPGRVPVLALRSRPGAAAVLQLPSTPQALVLWVEREAPARFARYQATLRSEAGSLLWQEVVTPTAREALLIGIDSAAFTPGGYVLTLEGESAGGRR